MIKEIKTVANELGEKIVEEIRSNMSEYGLGDSNLSKNLRFEANEESITVYAPEYFDYAEKGRGPGGVPSSWESIMKDWISRHHIKFDGEERTFIQNVKWATIRYGSRLYRHPSEQRNFLKGVIEKAEKWIEEDIKGSLIETIEEKIKE